MLEGSSERAARVVGDGVPGRGAAELEQVDARPHTDHEVDERSEPGEREDPEHDGEPDRESADGHGDAGQKP